MSISNQLRHFLDSLLVAVSYIGLVSMPILIVLNITRVLACDKGLYNLVLILCYCAGVIFFRTVTRECFIQNKRGNWFLFANKTDY